MSFLDYEIKEPTSFVAAILARKCSRVMSCSIAISYCDTRKYELGDFGTFASIYFICVRKVPLFSLQSRFPLLARVPLYACASSFLNAPYVLASAFGTYFLPVMLRELDRISADKRRPLIDAAF